MARDKVYTRTGDDGTTGLLYGGRVPKDSELPRAYGTVDEAQAVLGLARAEVRRAGGGEMEDLLVRLERELYVLMAELATAPANRHKLDPGTSAVTPGMVTGLEGLIDESSARFEPPTEFVVPGETTLAALLDVGRTVVRRAERHALAAAYPPSLVGVYLNRLSDLLWTMARWQEGHSLITKDVESRHPGHASPS
jgi:cob(I)alamin adenosyltransferase